MLAMMEREAARRSFEGVELDQLCRRLGTSEIARRAIDVAKPYPINTQTPELWLKDFDTIVAWLKRQRSKPPISRAVERKRLHQVGSHLAKAEALSEMPGYADLRDEIKRAGETAKRSASRVKVPLSGGRRGPDHHIKVLVAKFAFDLLNNYGCKATHTTDGDYFTLASFLFEAVTGRDDVSIARQCRQHITQMRKIGYPKPFRGRRKRTGRFLRA
jgi:hypothetical protein